MDEKTRMRLLGDLIDAIQDGRRERTAERFTSTVGEPSVNLCDRRPLNNLYAHFFTKRGRLITDDVCVTSALDYLFNGTTHFEEYDLDDAFRVEVHIH